MLLNGGSPAIVTTFSLDVTVSFTSVTAPGMLKTFSTAFTFVMVLQSWA